MNRPTSCTCTAICSSPPCSCTNRIKNTLCNYSAKQKYDWFLQEYPGLIFDVNNRYIASFLNMTPETLSRLRAADRKAGPTAGAPDGEKA